MSNALAEQTLTTGTDEPLPGEPPIWAAVGDTPLLPLRLDRVRPGGLWLKAEWLNPGGSVKDRAARAILRDGLRRGELPRKRLLDASSGNTAVAYALLGAAAGVRVTICVPANASPERLALLRIYGAEVVLTDRLAGTDGAIRRARELAAAHPDDFWYADQYAHPANAAAHHDTTGPELWRGLGGRLTHFVAGLGTTGTMMGAGRYLRERDPRIRLVAVQPDSPYHGLEGLKHLPSVEYVPPLYDPRLPDRVVAVATEEADATARRLAREEGLLVGWSTGAAVRAALDLLRAEPDAVVAVIGCDTGARYLSQPHRWEVG
ncbi:MAG TPA: PLP-dependent cysteine synthase family protein [Gemmatimonadales bacterium]|nr:PLP-dependent cysteine synthase family protein [Gemmatimonadales bacterium]